MSAVPQISPEPDDLLPLDPGMTAFGAAVAAAMPPGAADWPLPRRRAAWEEVCRRFRAPRPAGLAVADVTIAGAGGALALRVYRPAGAGRRPGVLYFHGGGWILGSLETHDDICAEIAAGADVAVVAVDYRLAPEHPHPAQIADALAARDWLLAEGAGHGVDAARLVAAGDSAGGEISAGLAIHLKDQGLPQLAGLALAYPILGADTDTPSYVRHAEASLSRTEMQRYLAAFLGPPERFAWRDARAVPLRARDVAGLPPTFLTAAGYDPLHDDAVMFARRLRAAGVPALLRREPALGHAYIRARHASAPAGAGFAAILAAIRALAHEGRLPEPA